MKGVFMDRENFMLEIADKDEQFAISYELLCLLRWIIENDADKLKKMITRAVSRGLNEKIERIQSYSDTEALEDAHENMIEFFSALEAMLMDTIQEQAMNQAFERKLIPAIEQIDTTACDDMLVQTSLERANSKIAHNPDKSPQEILLTEILKNWKPSSKKEALQ
jgi:hypothetical protein